MSRLRVLERLGGNRHANLRRTVVAGALYWLAASATLPLAVPGAIISPLWPAAALALILSLHWGRPAVLGTWAGAWVAFFTYGWAALPAAIAGAGAGLAAWSASALIEPLQRHEGDFIYNGNLFRFVLIALASGVVSAPLAIAGAMLDDRLGPAPLLGWLTWSLGTASGTVIFTPPLRAWRLGAGVEWTPFKKMEALAFGILLAAACFLTFLSGIEALSLAYLPLPFVIWAAYRFNLPAVAWSTALVCAVAALGTLRGTGPFARGDLNTAMLLLVVYVSVVGITGLTLSALIHQRGTAERKLKNERDSLERRVLERTAALRSELRERRRVEDQLAEAQRVAQIGSWHWNLDTREIVWSDQLYRIYKVEPGNGPIRARSYIDMVAPEDRERVALIFEDTRRTGEPFSFEHRIRLAGGATRIVAARGQGAKNESGRVVRLFGTVQDVTEMRQAEAALYEAQQHYKLVVEISPDAIVVQQDGAIVFTNPASLQLLGVQGKDGIVGRRVAEFIPAATHPAMYEHLHALRESAQLPPAEARLVRADGSEVDVEISSSPFSHQGRYAVLHIIRDITERKRSIEQMAHLAHYDSLTGLPNRILFHQRLEHALSIAERPGRSLELLFLDLDGFKQINDTYGHATGDLVLKETARRLQASLRESDTVARLAGDEFVVLTENVDEPQRGGTIAEKILAAFAPPFVAGSHSLHMGTSIGITSYPEDGTDADTLLKRADVAMYRAKQQGRNRYCYYSPVLDAQTAQRRSLEHALRLALERGELSLHYQPRIDVASGRTSGVEALLRWNHRDLGPIGPQEFIPIAEESGLMTAIGYWALRNACAEARAWHIDGAEVLQVAVNLSARQLADPGLVRQIKSILAETGLPAHHLEVELPEEAIISDPGQVMKVLKALHEIGVGLNIDHFGAGYSSLGHLKDCPIGCVKMDRSFVHGIPLDHGSAAAARAIISLAHSFGCIVVAQGAETRQQVDFLREHECDAVQGNYFSEPISAARLRERMHMKTT